MPTSKPKSKKCCECEKRFEVVKPLDFRCALCQVKMDQGAIEAVLEECDHHCSLSTLIVFYKAHKKFWDTYHPLVNAILGARDADEIKIIPHRNIVVHDSAHRMVLRDYQRVALNKLKDDSE